MTNPRLIAYSPDALALLGIDPPPAGETDAFEEKLASFLSGNSLPEGAATYAHCYCGHQFGGFAGQLGDGAAIYLGEVLGKDENRWELQLKGAGPTPYSRSSDGRKVLRSSIREFLCSEAMHFLGISSTRAGAIVTSDSLVERDPQYEGKTIQEKCTIVSRISQNLFRFGSFEIFIKRGPSYGNVELQKQLLDYIVQYFPVEIHGIQDDEERYLAFYKEVVRRTAILVAQWQSVGFVHGVLNTDNMSIMGATIDYGPFGFMEFFDPDFIPNGSDHSGRYTYEKQPEVCKWNLNKLREALLPLLPEEESKRVLDEYDAIFSAEHLRLFRNKLGLSHSTDFNSRDILLIQEFFSSMTSCATDFTDAFQSLVVYRDSRDTLGEESATESLLDNLTKVSATKEEWSNLMKKKMSISRIRMRPQQVMYFAQIIQTDPTKLLDFFPGMDENLGDIIEEVLGEKKKLDRLVACDNRITLLEEMDADEKIAHDKEVWKAWVDAYKARITENQTEENTTVDAMRRSNPAFVLRNWVATKAIARAEEDDYVDVRVLLGMLSTPYDNRFSTVSGKGATCSLNPITEKQSLYVKRTEDSGVCTCSS